MKPLALLALLALLAAAFQAPLAVAAEDLGRLFFTPEERADLDRRRTENVQESVPLVLESTLTLQGYVSRSSGRTTTWINGTPRNDTHRSADPSRVRISPGADEPDIELKVGQTMDRTLGEKRDGLGGGQIRIRPAAR